MLRLVIALALAAGSAGCTATGPTGSVQPAAAVAQPAAVAARPAGPVPRDKARLLLSRADAFLYLGVPTSVKLDGQEIASLWKGESATPEVAPGPHKLEVSCWSAPGTFVTDVDLPAGKAVAFEVSPRGEDYMAGVLLGPLEAVRQSVVQNSGPFKIVAVPAG